jgi:hypothetical protein
MKTLVIVYSGLLRGDNGSWSTILNHVVTPLNADLGVFCCYNETPISENILFKNAKYIHTIPEFSDFYEYYKIAYPQFLNEIKFLFEELNLYPFEGSAFFTLTLKEMIYNTYKETVKEYDQIILTRSDNFFLKDHLRLNVNRVHIPTGSDHKGVCDRHIVLPATQWKKTTGLIEFICNNINEFSNRRYLNAEKILQLCLKMQKMQISRFQRNHFLVYNETDKTSWPDRYKSDIASRIIKIIFENNEITAKYEKEYHEAMKCIEE